MARKKDKLYTANRWNQPLFAQGVDREHHNIFDGMFSSSLNASISQPTLFGTNSGLNYQTPQLTKPDTSMPTDWSNLGQSMSAVGKSQSLVDNFGKEAAANNPFSAFKTTKASGGTGNWKNAAPAIGNMVGSIGSKLISGGYESGTGSTISSVGSTVGGAISTVNPLVGGIVSAGSGIVGGLVNAAFGVKTDTKKLNAINEGKDYLKTYTSDASYYDDIEGPKTVADNTQGVYKGGWFSKGKAARKNAELAQQVNEFKDYAGRSVQNNIETIGKNQMDSLQHNWFALGGPLGSQGSGAVNYNFMSDYLTMRNKASENKNRVPANVFGNLPVTPLSTFALGGDMQTNGGDYSNGLIHIDAGGTHEQNPYEGVQLGISSENGQPNLVEEGETVFDDYVFSMRIKPDAKAKRKFHVGKNSDMSYADLSKKIAKESEERPNDAISQEGLKKQLHALAEEQERQKEEQRELEVQDAFAKLPPEQQEAIMQQVAMEEQQAAQAQQEQQLNAEQQQLSQQQPDAQQVVDAQMQAQQPQMEEAQMAACGGKLNKFDKGGDMKRQMYKVLGLYTDADFEKWRKEQKLDEVKDWESITKNEAFMAALAKANPALGDVIGKGYDFGAYKPTDSKNLTFDFKHGGWGLEDYNAWDGSTDAAWQEAVKKDLVKKGMKSKEIGEALMKTDAYKRGSDWLKADENNRLSYLQSIFNSADAPKAARDYAAKYVDANGWLKDAKRDYQTIFEDPNGTGVRNTHPGTYWKTPNEVLREKQAMNYEVADDGSIHEIIGDVPADWKNVGAYNWQDAKSDYSNNYYKRPGTATTAATPNGNAASAEDEYEPIHKATWGRTASLYGPLVGLGMQMAGIGKPDYSGLDAAIEASSGAPAQAHTRYLGNYIGYNPMDIWYEQNRLNANSRATDRAILNNNSTIGTKTAGLLANGYNNQIASGNLYRQALEYNDAQKQKVAEFNRGTDQFNAQAFNTTSATNAQLRNSQRNFRAEMLMNAAKQKMASDAAWNQGIYGNVNAFFKNLGSWGKENEQHNMIADMAADGLFGTMSDRQNIGKDYIQKKGTKVAKGGRINRKRGLTF